MTLNEIQSCAAETLTYFIQTMPEVPFAEDDIIIEFVPKKKMAERAKALCAKYVPDKIINESQTHQLNTSIAANALIGKEKSAVIARINYKATKQDWRMIFFHEFMHIYCGKLEMDGEHFIDTYGSGTTPENPDMTPDEKTYDGFLVAGHTIWSEFIAQYYAIKKVESDSLVFDGVVEYIFNLLGDVNVAELEISKGSFAMLSSYWLACDDAKETILQLDEPNFIFKDEAPYGKEARKNLQNCLLLPRKLNVAQRIPCLRVPKKSFYLIGVIS